MTNPSVSTSGLPPELPGLIAASVCTTSNIALSVAGWDSPLDQLTMPMLRFSIPARDSRRRSTVRRVWPYVPKLLAAEQIAARCGGQPSRISDLWLMTHACVMAPPGS